MLTSSHKTWIYICTPEISSANVVGRTDTLQMLKIQSESTEDDVIDQDIILLWGHKKQIITGADILGRLLRGIAGNDQD